MTIYSNIFILTIFISLVACIESDNPSKYLQNYTHIENKKSDLYAYTESEHLKVEIPSISLLPDKVYNSVESKSNTEKSNIFFQHVFSITPSEEGYLINDDYGGRIIHCNKKFKLLNIIGQKGVGPGEFSQPRYSVLDKGLLYSSGTSNRGFAVHDLKGGLVNNFKSKATEYNPIGTKFTVIDAEVFHSTPNSQHLIDAIDTKGNVIKSFGDKISKFSKENRKILNGGHLIKGESNSFYFIAENGPIIQKYSTSGELISTHDLMDHPYFDTFFRGVQERIRKSKRNDMIYLLSQDVQLYKQKLYLLSYGYDNDFNVSLQKVLVINLNKDQNLILEKEITLNVPETADYRAWFESISITDSKIVAFEANSGNFLEYSY